MANEVIKVRTEVELGFTRLDYDNDPNSLRRAVLEFETLEDYYDGGIVSTATVFWDRDGGRSHHSCIGEPARGDYSSTAGHSTLPATKPNIEKQHAQVFTPQAIAELTAAAKAHYAGRENVYE